MRQEQALSAWKRAKDVCLESCCRPGLSCSSPFMGLFSFDAALRYIQKCTRNVNIMLLPYTEKKGEHY